MTPDVRVIGAESEAKFGSETPAHQKSAISFDLIYKIKSSIAGTSFGSADPNDVPGVPICIDSNSVA